MSAADTTSSAGPELEIGLAIPAWRNIAGLRVGLQAVADVAPRLLLRSVVVDDSGDGRVAGALAAEFPGVRWIVHAANQGFGRSASEAVAAAPAPIVVLLNDDAVLLTDPTESLRDAFRNPALFAVTFLALRANDAFREGAKRLVWRFGIPRILHNERDQRPAGPDGARASDYAVGGHAAFHRERFLELGGFDPLFEPFYWEDVDLARRARARGWCTIYRPECRVRHAGESAIRSANDAARIREITRRNRILFAYRHCPPHSRPLLELSLAARATLARLSGDSGLRRACQEARARRYEAEAPPRPSASMSRAAEMTSSVDGPSGR